jgi:hypothetical protein
MPGEVPTNSDQFTSSGVVDADASSKRAAGAWENEGGHMSSRFGRIVRDTTVHPAYKVVLSHDDGDESERAFATMREAEAFVRRNTPRPQVRNSLRDRDAPEGQPAPTSTACHPSTL